MVLDWQQKVHLACTEHLSVIRNGFFTGRLLAKPGETLWKEGQLNGS